LRSLARIAGVALAAFALLATPAAARHRVRHIVVIYEENHSFDNLYGGWEGVDGLAQADRAHTRQITQGGKRYQCLLQNDVNLTSPPLSVRCHDTTTATAFDSHFWNQPFTIDNYIAPSDTTCPPPGADGNVPKGSGLPGGCTRDLVHRFYQEQYQLNGGHQNRYVTGSDAVGLTMGHYRTRSLPIYKYLHSPGHPKYAIEDRFFQSAFGGSFLNHQWLIAARTPEDAAQAPANQSIVDSNGMPTSYPLYTATGPVKDTAFTVACAPGVTLACGDFAVNTIQPLYQPHSTDPKALLLAAQTNPTIGDRLSDAGIDWAWYSGGWSNADGDVHAPGWTNGDGPTCTDPNSTPNPAWPYCPDKLFQYHHQPFNYYKSFAPGTAMRALHLRDEQEFIDLADASGRRCQLKPVSFIKPIGEENEHPGYASEHNGSDHLVDLLKDIEGSRCARSTMVIVTYDEFGGQWDHVSPPGQGSSTPGPHDVWGPGTRIPALVLSPRLRHRFVVDDASHDTTSIDATIEHRFGLAPLSSRDAQVNDLFTALHAHG
jgi:phospholipase C